MLFLSPRNSLEGQLHIIDAVKCKIFAIPSVQLPAVHLITAARNLRHLAVPELEDWLSGPPAPSRPFAKSFEEVRHEPMAMLHSSGTTGLPKPVGYTHGCLAAHLSLLRPPIGDQGSYVMELASRAARLFNAFPLFHAGGIFFPLALAVFTGVQIVLPPAGQPLDAGLASSIHQYGNVQSAVLPPATLEDISKESSSLYALRHLKYIITGGAPLPKSVGDVIQSAGPRIYNMIASTETGSIPTLETDRENWQYLRFATTYGIELRPHHDGLHELVIVRNEKLKGNQGVFENFPDLDEYPTHDLFRRHTDPLKSDYWISCGRFDDVIVLLNGEKFNPITMEKHIRAHPIVSSALVSGRNRVQAALLVELRQGVQHQSESDKYKIVDELWPTIEQANRHGPAHGRLSKSFVIFTTPEKPMHRTPKGNVNRNSTISLYEKEINALYLIREPNSKANGFKAAGESRLSLDLLRHLVGQVSGIPMTTLKNDDNLFSLGMDSLHVLHLSHDLNAVVANHLAIPGLIYRNPSVVQLFSALQSSRTLGQAPTSERIGNSRMMLGKYILNLPIAKQKAPRVVILTGSSGSLGSFLLRELAKNVQFSKVYCLVRSLPEIVPVEHSKVTFIKCDFSDPQLGLDYDVYSNLLHNVTDILHNAWQVNFNLSLESFDPHIRGVRHLVDFSARSHHNAHIFFTSSVSAVMNLPSSTILEQVYEDVDVAASGGYPESKHIAELLLHQAGLQSHVPSTICRIGQIAGPVHEDGVWNKREWLPSLIISSKHILCVPDSLGSMDTIQWVPVDTLARIIVELFESEEARRRSSSTMMTQVYHVVNPSTVSWSSILPVVAKHLGDGSGARVVSLSTWTDRLRATSSESLEDVQDNNPALKLLDFFERNSQQQKTCRCQPTFDMTNALERSKILSELGPVSPEWMAVWMRQWGF